MLKPLVVRISICADALEQAQIMLYSVAGDWYSCGRTKSCSSVVATPARGSARTIQLLVNFGMWCSLLKHDVHEGKYQSWRLEQRHSHEKHENG